jgi:RIO kinase 1
MHDAGVRVPRPVLWADNVLVMEFIGKDGTPAPLLKDAALAHPARCFEQVARDMDVMWNQAGLVHGDLSEYNIMAQRQARKDVLTLIDVGQAVMQKHPMAREFLDRDARNVARYFRKLGVEGATPQALLDRVLKGDLARQAEQAGHPETRFEPEDPKQEASIALDQEDME